MNMRVPQLVTITAPSSNSLTTAQAKAHLRVDISDDDTYIDGLVSAADRLVESMSGVRLFTQTVELRLDGFPTENFIDLRTTPVASITSVKYDDTDDAEQTMTSTLYWSDLVRVPGRIVVKNNWPATKGNKPGSVRIRMVAGAAQAAIQTNLLEAVRLIIGEHYTHRTPIASSGLVEVPFGVAALLGHPETTVWNL